MVCMKKVTTLTILGSTGAYGRAVLDVIRKHPKTFKVIGLSCYKNTELLSKQIEEFKPKHYFTAIGAVESQLSIFDYIEGEQYRANCLSSIEELASLDSDIVVSTVTGLSGLWAAVATLKRGAILAIANKETLVCAGKYLKQLEKKYGGVIIPLDTEHSAIQSALKGENPKDIKQIILTASGGAFRDKKVEELEYVKSVDALFHPNWNMGKKITVDSATLFNKALEIVEAKNLFEISSKKISVLMHRESIIHSIVELNNGTQKAILSTTSLRIPIENALYYPEVQSTKDDFLNLAKIGQLNFSELDENKFPMIPLMRKAMEKSDGVIVALSSADEVLVEKFLEDKIKFLDIYKLLEKVYTKFENTQESSIDDVLKISLEAKTYAKSLVRK